MNKGNFKGLDGGGPTDRVQELTSSSFDHFLLELEEKEHDQRLNQTFIL